MNITLIRDISDPEVTEGEIFDDQGNKICESLELPNLGNEPEISCIPEGQYSFTKLVSGKLGLVYRLSDVPGRELIDLHSANITPELRGCICVGLTRGTLNYQGKIYPAVLNSRAALAKLMTIAGENGIITITSK